jgi:bifunctional ADP-heptose synthase (sugar kinase/adenylyltransferase)
VKSTGAKELVIIDFGHGLLSDQAVQFLLAQDLNISVNAQSNAGNRGFNPISRYKGAKRIFINGTELELEARKRTTNREYLIQEMVPALNCDELYVTQGAAGILYWNSREGVKRAPGFSPTIVDRVGAGDALLSTISALRANNVPIEIASFYGNIAGALMVSLLGNATSISKAMLLSEAEAILRSVGR